MTTLHPQITTSQIPTYRARIAADQGHRCPLCMERLALGTPTLDHNHENGCLRGVLCNTCNRSEGKILAAIRMIAPANHLVKTDTVLWLQRVVDYIIKHNESPSNIIHPTFDQAKGKQKPKKRKTAARKPRKKKA